MSNTKDWFQVVYSENEDFINKLVDIATKENMALRLSIHPDGGIIFTASNDRILKTITNGSKSIIYTQQYWKEDE